MTTQSENNKIYIKKKKKNNINPAHSESTQAKKNKKNNLPSSHKKTVKK